MKQMFFAFAFLFITATGICQPKLEIAEAKRNFGFVKRGIVVKCDYEISNVGNQPLILDDAEVACSCTTVDYPDEPILPNQKATIVVSFDTKSAYGRQDRIVKIFSNDPKSPAKLRFKGTVSQN